MDSWSELLVRKPVNTIVEMGAYECLWQQPNASTKRLAELFEQNPGRLPSELIEQDCALDAAHEVLAKFEKKGLRHFGVRVFGTSDYPDRLRDAREPIEVLYYAGFWELVDAPRRVAVVGTRQVTADGIGRTKRLVRELVEHDYTIVSGLAEGVDTVAHETAIKHGGRTIAVIGTPISEYYPRKNEELQRYIAENFLLISQVPVLRYAQQGPHGNRLFFPERNKTMSALTEATIIVEASETSGTLIQARAAIQQKRKVFILDSNFTNPNITWPAKYEKLGAIRVKDTSDILRELA